MIPALVLIFLAVVFRISTALVVQGGGSYLAFEFRAARRDRSLQRDLFPGQIQVYRAVRGAARFGCRAQSLLRRVAL